MASAMAIGLGPLLFLLVDFQQVFQRFLVAVRAAQLEEDFLGAIEQAGLEVVLAEFGQRVQALVRRQAIAFDQVLMDADGAVGFAAAAKQAAQREMQLDGLRIDARRFDEGLDGLVGLLVEQEVQALEIGARQGARLFQQMLDVDARRDPAEPKKTGRTSSHQSSISMVSARPAIGGACCGRRKPPSARGQSRPPTPNGEHGKDHHRNRRRPGLVEKEAQFHRSAVLDRQAEQADENRDAQQPDEKLEQGGHEWIWAKKQWPKQKSGTR
jgi:hypothetical protein